MPIQDPIIVEKNFDAPVQTVWNAITQGEQMSQWLFENIRSFKPEVGFETDFSIQSGERSFHHQWKVTEVVPLQKISYSWNYAEYEGDSLATFELSEDMGQTKLRLSHAVVEPFPSDIPEFERESGVAGWNYLIRTGLKEFLDKSS